MSKNKTDQTINNPRENPDGGLINAHDELGALVIQASHWLYLMYNGHLGQRKIISILSNVESMTQKELQHMLGIKPSSASEIITKLENKGDIIRTRDEKDKRKVVLKITESGRLKNKYQQEMMKTTVNQKVGFDVLTPEEQETLKQLLTKLLNKWEEVRDGSPSEE